MPADSWARWEEQVLVCTAGTPDAVILSVWVEEEEKKLSKFVFLYSGMGE